MLMVRSSTQGFAKGRALQAEPTLSAPRGRQLWGGRDERKGIKVMLRMERVMEKLAQTLRGPNQCLSLAGLAQL